LTGRSCRVRVEAALQLLAAVQRSRASEGRNPVVGLQIVERFGQPFFHPAPRVLVFGEENQPPLVPAAVRYHVGLNPFDQPADTGIGSVAVLSGDLQHLVHESEVGNARRNSPCRLAIRGELSGQNEFVSAGAIFPH
jgi:hypothetical protein